MEWSIESAKRQHERKVLFGEVVVLIKTTTLGHQSVLAKLMHDGWDCRVFSCVQTEISGKALFVQNIVKLQQPVSPLHTTTKQSRDTVDSR